MPGYPAGSGPVPDEPQRHDKLITAIRRRADGKPFVAGVPGDLSLTDLPQRLPPLAGPLSTIAQEVH
jgi:hypothetical protein